MFDNLKNYVKDVAKKATDKTLEVASKFTSIFK